MTASSLRLAFLEGHRDPIREVKACLMRCVDDDLNALISIDKEGALTAAEAARDRYRKGVSLGVWDGVPYVAKDNIAAAGLPWTAGIGAYRGRIAERDAEIIASLKSQGAILIGKANLHEAALGTTNNNPWFGKCHNPHRKDYTPGGSSGGSAAAVAGGLTPLALGTDTMGSVRVPAAFCGVYGYKPGPGVVSQEGVTPLSLMLDTVGLIAVSSVDLETYGRSLSGLDVAPDNREPVIGMLDDDALASCTTDIRRLYQETLSRLRAAGLWLERVPWFDDPSANRRAGLALVITDAYVQHAEALESDPEGFSDDLRGFLAFGRDFPSGKLEVCKARVDGLRQDQPMCWASVDVVLTPASPYPAHAFEQDPPDDLADFTAPANLIGLPASSLPFGRSENGLPFGLQLIGRRGEDSALLAVTRCLDQILNPEMQETSAC